MISQDLKILQYPAKPSECALYPVLVWRIYAPFLGFNDSTAGSVHASGRVSFTLNSHCRAFTWDALTSFPHPALRSASQQFRGETGF